MMFWSCLLHAIIIFAWTSFSLLVTTSSSGESDRLALLAFKDKINSDPLGGLSSWNKSLHHCQWNGVTCSLRHHDRVTILNLETLKLEGTLSPHIGNLSFLKLFALSENNFHGPIPQEIGRLFRLQGLYFYSNSFEGAIPTNLSQCSNLRLIILQKNKLSGEIPVELTSLSKLTRLDVSNNELKGRIPPLGGNNISSLVYLYLEENSLSGRINIPNELCYLKDLMTFTVYDNSLTGTVPSCLYNLSHIIGFSLVNNQLEGSLPMDIGLTLPNLEELFVGGNRFRGPIPSSLPNASRLERIALGFNQFTGKVPRDLGRLKNLNSLSLNSNKLGSTSSSNGEDLNFIASLTNCTVLEKLSLRENSLKGLMPNAIVNLSTTVTYLSLARNEIYGSIPAGIENLANLTSLDFSYNNLTGEIPSQVLGMLPKLRELYLQGNQFSGKIPDSFNNSTQLLKIYLSRNNLHGTIPLSLGDCHNLAQLDLSRNKLNGTIPKEIFLLSSLNHLLDLSHNALTGSLPLEVRNLSNLVQLDVSSNRLVGHIPSTLGDCLNLVYLNMSGNFFNGLIPQSLVALKGLKVLVLSSNNLSGEIPKFLGNFTLLTLDLSYNELEGPVPNDGVFANVSAVTVDGNSKLCGGAGGLKLPPCDEKILNKGKSSDRFLKLILPVVVGSLLLVLSLCFVVYMVHLRRMSRKKPSSPSLLSHQHLRISYDELLKATNNFSTDNLVGVGSYGSVYKGLLDQTNTIVAVKVLNLQQQGASKSFLSECSAVKNLRHRNLLKIITSCSSIDFQGNDFKALVFEFIANGSLEEWLHPDLDKHLESRNLNFLQKLDITIDIASAMDYLHHYCQPPIVHCDLKPANVLLDDEMTAHVADFGLAKILSSISASHSHNQGSSLAIKGSIGYVAPEYGMGSEVSVQGDVYSYGILLLEMFIGKRPTDSMFQNGLTLHNFAKMALPIELINTVDLRTLLKDSGGTLKIENQADGRDRMQVCLASAIWIGVRCSTESPIQRMDMKDVLIELYHIKDYYQGIGNHSG